VKSEIVKGLVFDEYRDSEVLPEKKMRGCQKAEE
jgi:hypothetical protein